MTCEQIRAAMRDRFDRGEPFGGSFDAHTSVCVACRRYRASLTALDECLAELPLQSPSPGFARALEQRLITLQRRDRVGAVAAGLLVAGSAIATGWVWPLELDVHAWWSNILALLPTLDKSSAHSWAEAWAGRVDNLWAWIPTASARLISFPRPVLWPLLGGIVALLLAVNGWEVWRERAADGGSGEGRTEARRA